MNNGLNHRATEVPFELPEYPPLPTCAGALVLDELESWAHVRACRVAELAAAYETDDADELAAVAELLDDFADQGRRDDEWVHGYLSGRGEAALRWPAHTYSNLAPAHAAGRAAGLREGAERLASVGAIKKAGEAREAADALVANYCPHCGAAGLDRGATGLDACGSCGGLSRGGLSLSSFEAAR